ncbi:MAG: hypothetical protein RLY31_2850 [Bacteroidota bacterium]|jgi:acetylornithine deacetylase
MKDILTSSIGLLRRLVETPSFSREEDGTADLLQDFLQRRGAAPERDGNNVWVRSRQWDPDKPVLLLNSHHDTVRPVAGWQRDPFSPTVEDGRLYGLGSNDAGGALVSLVGAFLALSDRTDLRWNLLLLASAEEEISGSGGVSRVLPVLGPIDAGIVGEPTGMQMAVAEKGLLVIDAEVIGRAGHAAREEGVNALYLALDDIDRLRNYRFEKESAFLGPVKVTVTQIEAGRQHNIIPDRCRYVVDVRTNEHYPNEAAYQCLQALVQARLTARSFRLNASHIPLDHPLVRSGLSIGMEAFGSPTLSDQALMSFPTLKLGPGDSRRSHTADEYILLAEIEEAVALYQKIICSS